MLTPTHHRAWIFIGIGAAGFALQLSVLHGLTAGFRVSPALATAVAVELALLHNFIWHERWTWADRTGSTQAAAWRRLLRFHGSNGLVSLAGNLILTPMAAAAGLPMLFANAIAVGACAAMNFVAADRLVFGAAGDAAS
jgi:putative flippase GtrA